MDVDTTKKHLAVLGSDPDHPTDLVEVRAPVSGIITDQTITNASAVQAFATPYPFTISDMSNVWIICDVFENNLAQVHMDEYADVHLNAYPDRVLKGRISNIDQVLDPNLHTVKVRLEMPNQGLMRIGMFAIATIHGDKMENHPLVPDTAILRLHDREFVYTPAPDNHFRRLEVVSGSTIADKATNAKMTEIVSGLKAGDKVVEKALVLQSTVEQ